MHVLILLFEELIDKVLQPTSPMDYIFDEILQLLLFQVLFL